jgi:hypothetical protein
MLCFSFFHAHFFVSYVGVSFLTIRMFIVYLPVLTICLVDDNDTAGVVEDNDTSFLFSVSVVTITVLFGGTRFGH